MGNEELEINFENCVHCGASLTASCSVVRTYVCKGNIEADDDDVDDNEDASVVATGHYDDDVFESDTFDGFGDGSFDILDDSDTCAACGGQL